mmetsp:Transcript_11723/g.29649  ORF Transcript_11723/g.29649 Transcript_11723/m.29649 type:complete len:122 (-) Transcript_11723:359-724(-)
MKLSRKADACTILSSSVDMDPITSRHFQFVSNRWLLFVRSNGETDDLVICSASGDAMELIDVYHFDDKFSSLAAVGQTAYAGGKSLHVLSIRSVGKLLLSKSISWNMNQMAHSRQGGLYVI